MKITVEIEIDDTHVPDTASMIGDMLSDVRDTPDVKSVWITHIDGQPVVAVN